MGKEDKGRRRVGKEKIYTIKDFLYSLFKRIGKSPQKRIMDKGMEFLLYCIILAI